MPPDNFEKYKNLESKVEQLEGELAEYRNYFAETEPIMEVINNNNTAFVKALIGGNITLDLVNEFNVGQQNYIKMKKWENEMDSPPKILECPKCRSTGNVKKTLADDIICMDCGHIEESSPDWED